MAKKISVIGYQITPAAVVIDTVTNEVDHPLQMQPIEIRRDELGVFPEEFAAFIKAEECKLNTAPESEEPKSQDPAREAEPRKKAAPKSAP